ncbi:rifin [Plasmodium falciparum IGH-CR14]|uniref:Rifin n=1 Tax=Plasmodium falciparum IGH-CR14 TaxID=580059 RepID=A0A0L1I7B0_PLAFA|nr:rifin [Plasmodium falciparum IGH-CR14]
MKIHYTNILLFPLKLNILVNTHKKPHTTARHTQKIPTTRSLSECELYAPVNYYSDPQMKEVMDNFNKQTQQRFHEYDERMKTTRQKCKEKCDKEIQKIILKDKIEKELNEKFSALHTDIQSDDIPTCICEKSLADKVEKGCLRCGSILGAAMPELGLVGGNLLYALNQWKTYALFETTKYALAKGAAQGAIAGNAQGVAIVLFGLNKLGIKELYPELLQSIGSKIPYYDIANIAKAIITKKNQFCGINQSVAHGAMCEKIDFNFGMRIRLGSRVKYGPPARDSVPKIINNLVDKATSSAEAEAAQVSSETSSKILTKQTDVINTIYMSNQTAIIASIIAIIIIVSIMVIIYLILRYRRKKKMKKKLLYIKLLEE